MKILLRKIKKELRHMQKQFQQAYDNREPLIIRPYRCSRVAEYLGELIEDIDKALKE